MLLFNQKSTNLTTLKEKPFKLEKDIQNLFEANLFVITGFQLIKSEFSIKNNRIDTLAFDAESHSFVIIEYKRDKNYSVVDQGVSYLNLMLEYFPDFIVEFNETQEIPIKKSQFDRSQSKIIFVSPAFNDFQKQSTNFKDFNIELWEIKQFENDVILINPIKKSKSAPGIKYLEGKENSEIEKISKEIKTYNEEGHLQGKSDEVKELYDTFRNAILNLPGEIELVPKKFYIAFKSKTNITDIEIQAHSIKLWINLKKGQLKDPKSIMRDVSTLKGHNGNGDYEINIKDTNDLEYIMSLIKQAMG